MGKCERGNGEWGSPSHYFWLKTCTTREGQVCCRSAQMVKYIIRQMAMWTDTDSEPYWSHDHWPNWWWPSATALCLWLWWKTRQDKTMVRNGCKHKCLYIRILVNTKLITKLHFNITFWFWRHNESTHGINSPSTAVFRVVVSALFSTF